MFSLQFCENKNEKWNQESYSSKNTKKKKIDSLWTSFTEIHLGNFQIWQEKMPAASRESRPISKKGSNKENTLKIRTNQNLQNEFLKPQEEEEEEEDESSVKIEEDWINIGDECFQNPVSITANATLKQVVQEFVIPDPVPDQCDHLNEIRKKRKHSENQDDQSEAEKQEDQFEAGQQEEQFDEKQEEIVLDMSYAFIKNHKSNLDENYVSLDIINERFMMSTVVDLEEKKDKGYTLPSGFRTKRRYLYEI